MPDSEPQMVKELRTFLGMTGWCRLWIYNYGLMVKPLYDLIKINQSKLVWTGEAQKVFKQELMILKYQAILVELDDVEIVVTNVVNPASFLSGTLDEPITHDCIETMETVYSS